MAPPCFSFAPSTGTWRVRVQPAKVSAGICFLTARSCPAGPFRDYSQITVYHPSEGNGHGFVNVGYTAFIGGLTGMSAAKLGISEIGAAFADASFGEMSRMGVPFVFLLRDILQFDYTIDDAINRMINSRRTCDLMLGVGDGKLNEFRGFQYSYSVLNIFNDLNLKPDNSTWHPKIKDIVYWGMVRRWT